MDKNYVIGENDNHFQLKDARLYYKNKIKCYQQITWSVEVFPTVAHFLNNELGPFLISQSEIKNIAIINFQTNLYRLTYIKENEK
jgi:hypothetical protein